MDRELGHRFGWNRRGNWDLAVAVRDTTDLAGADRRRRALRVADLDGSLARLFLVCGEAGTIPAATRRTSGRPCR